MRDNNYEYYECAKNYDYQNNKKIKRHLIEKDQNWEEKARAYEIKKIKKFEGQFAYIYADLTDTYKKIELYEKALEEKENEINDLEVLIKIKDQTYIEMLGIKNNEINELIEQIEKMKCCKNCKYGLEIDYDLENEFAFYNCKYKYKCKYYAFDLDGKNMSEL